MGLPRHEGVGENARLMRRALITLSLCLGGALALAGCQVFFPPAAGSPRPVRRPVAQAAPLNVNQHQRLAQARAAMDAGKSDIAAAMFRDLIAEAPTFAMAYVGLGDVYLRTDQPLLAQPVFERAARLEPRNFQAQFGLARALQLLERGLDAVRAYRQALSIEPESFDANRNIAATYLLLKRPDDALPFARKAIEIQPDDGQARTVLARTYARLDRRSEAIDEYLLAIEVAEDVPALTWELINVLVAEKRYRETAIAAANLARLQPAASAYERLGWAHFKLKEYEEAQQAYEQAVQIDPRHWRSLNGLGVIALNRWLLSGKQDDESLRAARDALRTSLRIKPDQQRVIRLMTSYGL